MCRGAASLLNGSKWSLQGRVVPAQYYRDPEDIEAYLEHSAFLADINNERELKNTTYAENLAGLKRLVMVMFGNDTTVVPKESAWFAEVNRTSGVVTPLQERPIYKEDWVGLKRLGDAGRLEFEVVPGEHMRIGEGGLERIFKVYFGPKGKVGSVRWEEADEL